ncbi:hypothetical protein C8Q78DRAFT_470828 [Trametes maxima]|nr:hypothetical protein C8Q78DRAFT_470828 [Trametes maxima]
MRLLCLVAVCNVTTSSNTARIPRRGPRRRYRTRLLCFSRGFHVVVHGIATGRAYCVSCTEATSSSSTASLPDAPTVFRGELHLVHLNHSADVMSSPAALPSGTPPVFRGELQLVHLKQRGFHIVVHRVTIGRACCVSRWSAT